MRRPNDIFTSVSVEEAIKLAKLAHDKVVLEIGSWTGYSTVVMGQVAKQVHAVDWHKGDEHAGHNETLPEMWANINRYGLRDKIVIHVGRSEEVLPLLRPDSFDMVFIDGFHRIDAVLKDIDLALPLMKVGATWAFHDYGDERFDVTEAVDAFHPGEKEITGSLAVFHG